MEEEERSNSKNIEKNNVNPVNSLKPKLKKKWVSRNKYLGTSSNRKPNSGSYKMTKDGSKQPKPHVFTCDQCDKTYNSKYSLTVHVISHTGQKPFQCDECDKEFSTNYQLERHKFSHTKYSDLNCEFCGKPFATKDVLDIHVRSHTGERPFPCDKCELKYPSRSSLNRHYTTAHSGESFLCDECGKTFSSKGTLQVHSSCHVRERNFPCSKCRLKFKRLMDLQRHLKTHNTETQRLSCPFKDCKHQFRRRDNMLRHLRLTHEVQNNSKDKTETKKSNLCDIQSDLRSQWKLPNSGSKLTPTNQSSVPETEQVRTTERITSTSTNDQDGNWNQTQISEPSSSATHSVHPTNQRSVIRSTDSLELHRNREQSIITNLPTTEQSLSLRTDANSSQWNNNDGIINNDDMNSRAQDKSELIRNSPHYVEQRDQSPPHTQAPPSPPKQSFIREFHYGTLFPFKPHVQPEKFSYHEQTDYRASVLYSNTEDSQCHHPPPAHIDNQAVGQILDLSDSNYPRNYDEPANYIMNSQLSTVEPTILYSNNFNGYGLERPQNVPVIRRASPLVARKESEAEAAALPFEDSTFLYNKTNEIDPSHLVNPSTHDYNNPTGDILEGSEFSTKPNEDGDTTNTYQINQHAIRDPRKNFLWEHFNKQY